MKILLYGSTYITELVEKELMKHYQVIGHIPSKNPIFKGDMKSPIEHDRVDYDIAISVQYDQKITNLTNCYNLHTGLLPEYGGCDILYHTIENKEDRQGLTFHKVTENFDEGEVLLSLTYPVLKTDKVVDLYLKICQTAPLFAVNCIEMLKNGISKGIKYKPNIYKRGEVKDIKKYNQDKIDIENSFSKTLKVIVCALSKSRNERTQITYPDHNQKILCDQDHFDMWTKLIENEVNEDAGIPMDTLIVCNGDCGGFFLKYKNIKETKNGKLIIKYRDNIGGSFGGYSYAYENFKYKNYIFTEDDLFVLGNEYGKTLAKWFYEEENCGLIALIGLSSGVVYPVHAHGGCGFTSLEVLNKISINGKLPYPDGEWCRPKAIRDGEVALSLAIVDKGYRLVYRGTNGWDRDNFIMPYYDLINN